MTRLFKEVLAEKCQPQIDKLLFDRYLPKMIEDAIWLRNKNTR